MDRHIFSNLDKRHKILNSFKPHPANWFRIEISEEGGIN